MCVVTTERPAADAPLTAQQREWVDRHRGLVGLYLGGRSRYNAPRFYRQPGDDMDDLAQAGMLGLMRAAQLWEPALGGWVSYALWHIHAKVNQRAWAERRRRKRERSLHVRLRDPDGLVEWDVPDGREPPDLAGLASIDDAIRALSPPQQRAVGLVFLVGLTYRQAGRRLGVSAEAVRQNVRAGLGNLARMMNGKEAA